MSVCVGQQLSSQVRRTSLIMIFDRKVTFWRVCFNYCTFLWQWQPDMAATTQRAKGHQADVGPNTTIGAGQWRPDGFCAWGSIYTDERKQWHYWRCMFWLVSIYNVHFFASLWFWTLWLRVTRPKITKQHTFLSVYESASITFLDSMTFL